LGKKLTQNQLRFADEYIISGNATDAYKKSYTSVKKDNVARANASRLLTNANVIAYVKKRNNDIQSSKTATMQEVREFWTNVIRDDDAEMKDKIKVSELIGKSNGEFLDRLEQSGGIDIRVDWHD